MDAPRELKLTLPPDLAQTVRAEMETGDYVDEIEVVREALNVLTGAFTVDDQGFDATVRARYAAWNAGNRPTISMEDIRAEFAAEKAVDHE